MRRPLGGAGLQRFYFGKIARHTWPESLSQQAVVHIARSGQAEARLRRPCSSHHVAVRKPRFERQVWSPPWAAQPAHAADRLPRRVLRCVALASCLWVEYTCRWVSPANGVAVRLSCLACRLIGRNTPAADARAVGRRGSSAILICEDSTARLARESINASGDQLTGRVTPTPRLR